SGPFPRILLAYTNTEGMTPLRKPVALRLLRRWHPFPLHSFGHLRVVDVGDYAERFRRQPEIVEHVTEDRGRRDAAVGPELLADAELFPHHLTEPGKKRAGRAACPLQARGLSG